MNQNAVLLRDSAPFARGLANTPQLPSQPRPAPVSPSASALPPSAQDQAGL